MKYQPATMKAGVVTSLFALFAVVSSFFMPPQPLAMLLYAFILIHTFFSIRCFSALIDVRDLRQWVIDIVLVVSYAAFAFSMHDLAAFFVVFVWVFFVATMKYALLIGRLRQPILLQRKITADILGAVFGGVGYAATVLSVPYSATLLVTIFAAGTFYYLVVAPLYVPDALTKG
ncbi:hypothetical protein KBC55_04180 [Patescibacteria group bacterium]|nr:hypothetical protein [Patescibacteria group bacterium]